MRYICLIFMLFICACSQPQDSGEIAVQGKLHLRSADFSQTDKIALYELHWQEYLTLRVLLQNWVAAQHSNEPVSSFLQRPQAPTLEYTGRPDWVVGDENAVVNIQLFCTLVSEPCKRIYRELIQYMPFVQGGMRIEFYESWQAFHKLALPVAAAMACAPAQGKADLRQFLLAENPMDAERIEAVARMLGFDMPTFNQCRQAADLQQRLQQQPKRLQQAGFNKPAALLINSRYLALADWERLFAYLQTYLPAPDAFTAMPDLQVQQIYPVQGDALDFADVIFQGQALRWALHQCQADWCLYKIEKEQLIFFHAGRFYTSAPVNLPAPAVAGQHVPDAEIPEPVQDHTAPSAPAERELADDDHAGRVRALLAATPPSPLSRHWLDEALNRQAELEKNFIYTDMEVEGQHLLKLQPDVDDAFFTQLGLQGGDVLMRINDEWVHGGYNNLWETLRSGERVEISLMRHGLPVHLVFAVQEP